MYRALSNEEVSENLKVAVVHKQLQDAFQKQLLRSTATLGSFTSIKDEVISCSLAEAAVRRTAPLNVDQLHPVKGKGKDGRRCFYCDGKGRINCPQEVIDAKKKSDFKLIVDWERHACAHGRDSSGARIER